MLPRGPRAAGRRHLSCGDGKRLSKGEGSMKLGEYKLREGAYGAVDADAFFAG